MKLRDDAIVSFELDEHEWPIRPGKTRASALFRGRTKNVPRAPYRPSEIVLIDFTEGSVLVKADLRRASDPRTRQKFLRAALAPKGTNR